MRKTYRGRAALALIACLPCAPAWAAQVDDAHLDTAPVFQMAHQPIAPESTALVPTDPQLLAIANSAPDWDLADISQGRSDAGTIALPEMPQADPAAYGPAADLGTVAAGEAEDSVRLTPSGHVRRAYTPYRTFGQQVGSSTTEILLLSAYVGVQSIPKFFKETRSFHFHDEGWFGKNTQDIGMDKLTHAYNTYLIAELLHHRIHRNTGGAEGDALTAGILAAGMMALNEVSDAIEPDAGYSMQDIVFNLAGAGFSVLRNTVPGLKEKLAFKIEIMPNDDIYSHVGKKHYEQERFMLSLKGAGFEKLQNSPFKYLDLQLGYYASDFLNSDRAKGIEPKKHLFVGVGLNLGELLFGKSQSTFGKAAYSVLDYVQLPYTSLRADTHGDLVW